MKRKTILKSRITYLLLLFALTISFTACEDDDDDVIIYVHTYEDAQEAIAISLAYDSYGLVAYFENISNEIEVNNECDVLYEDSDTETGEFNSSELTTYVYNYNEIYTKYCDPELYVDYALSAEQLIESVRVSTTHNINVNLITTGLEETSENEIYNGTYNRNGGWETEYSEEYYNFSYSSEVSDILLSKATGEIISGTSTFTLTQDYGYNNLTYTYEGVVEFLNKDEAKVTFDDGSVFYINISNLSISI
ncbi:hypothetical protein FNB79_15070 [Formosa sediminum]|uniref:DUF4595 domain-containing protein n=1 Tax=Formosa sediminum TaxID=2594004 RepID=A0A516GUP1_9FLAO|nr:hypothetical protein [Formosa sediminum]QDO95237.1 hypothetical protein FNB79_15070 [Formosa sediminum]